MKLFQVSNWFINARVRLWKPMVEEMYQKEAKEGEEEVEEEDLQSDERKNVSSRNQYQSSTNAGSLAQTVAPNSTATVKNGSQINALDCDPSGFAINTQLFSETQVPSPPPHSLVSGISASAALHDIPPPPPPASQRYDHDSDIHRNHRARVVNDVCRRGVGELTGYGTTTTSASGAPDDMAGPTLISFGTTAGDVSLTLGLRHAGNLPEKNPFSVGDFGSC